ncbi:MAG: hypothetical protein DRH15_05430 [Deltaproteobacteria bacterium]|nr:MAG: hypothetical protein DRH15_05430 [Deltaproteobacteria bacterium]
MTPACRNPHLRATCGQLGAGRKDEVKGCRWTFYEAVKCRTSMARLAVCQRESQRGGYANKI